MPSVRRRRTTERQTAQSTDENSLANLRQRCAEKGLPIHGRRDTLVARLQQHASASLTASPSVSPSASSSGIQASPTPPPNLLTDAQIAQIQSIVTRSVEQSVNEIATNVATTGSSVDHVTEQETVTASLGRSSVPNVTLPQAETNIPYGHGSHDVPAAYVKQIQSGEFFDLNSFQGTFLICLKMRLLP